MTCTFCAFTFHGSFRRRSKERILEEMRLQIERYGLASFYVVDDLVTTGMIQDVFPHLPGVHPRLRIPFMEMRTACDAKHLDLVARAGVQLVQPGIESMDDGLLKRMSKGTTTFHNLMFMKWARERGVRLSYNIILGFPGTTAEELESQYDTLRLIPHLDPGYALELSLVRFSPYYHDPARYGMGPWHPHGFYRFLFPDGLDIERIAYEYRADYDTAGLTRLYRATVEYLHRWQRMWSLPTPPYLWLEEDDGGLLLRDGRIPGEPETLFPLRPPESDLYRALMDRPLSPDRLAEQAGVPLAETEQALARFEDEGLVRGIRGRYLALALDRERTEAASRIHKGG